MYQKEVTSPGLFLTFLCAAGSPETLHTFTGSRRHGGRFSLVAFNFRMLPAGRGIVFSG